MPMQQMALMAYKAPPAGGGDSAYLPVEWNVATVQNADAFIEFYPSSVGSPSSNVRGVGDILSEYMWKTGPYAADAYEVQFIQTSGSIPEGSAVNTWITLGFAEIPRWSLQLGVGNNCAGRLVIRNISNPGVELANATFSLSADPNA